MLSEKILGAAAVASLPPEVNGIPVLTSGHCRQGWDRSENLSDSLS